MGVLLIECSIKAGEALCTSAFLIWHACDLTRTSESDTAADVRLITATAHDV